MKPTKTQIALAYIASISLVLMVFHRRLGLADYWEWILGVVWLLGLVAFFLSRRRQKAALSVTEATASKPSRPNKKIMWLSLVLVIVTSLSSFFWLPYTGVAVSHTQLIMISIMTCILSLTAYLIAWRRSHRSNQSLEPTAGRRDVRILIL
jgi:hypothetical protein